MIPLLSDISTASRRFVFGMLGAALIVHLLGCDSRQRGESQTAATEDGLARISETGPGHPERRASLPPAEPEEDATEPPDAEDLERFTEDLEDDGELLATIFTNHGQLECTLFEQESPVAVANFVGLARGLKAFVDPLTGERVSGLPYYDGVEFHRVIPGELIQTGDRTGQGQSGPGYTLPRESSDDLAHDRPGILSMARRGEENAGGQFFVTEQARPELDGEHTVFGHCEPEELIRTISHVPTRGLNRPVDPVPRIETIRFRRGN